jgi:D-aspartate ligase
MSAAFSSDPAVEHLRSGVAPDGSPSSSRPPFLLTMPTYGGTLAAVRSLGQRGIDVTVAGHERLAPAQWSRFATRRMSCPPASDTRRFLDWLLAFGDREPKHVLYASSDDLAFLFAANARDLGSRFYMYQPSVEDLVNVLDKKRLHDACAAAGLGRVPTWFPESDADVARIAREAFFPVILKTRTQVQRVHQNKGSVVHEPDELLPAYRRFLSTHRFRPGLEPYFGDVCQPMIQRYLPDAARHVYSVTGFVDRAGALWSARGARKVLQRTQPVGLGLCFEAATLEPELAASVVRLCRRVGHYGVFEVEFLLDGDDAMVIDLNPRFYGQMGFDAARGMPLALLTYYAAIGDAAALHDAIGHAADAARSAGGASIYTHRFVFELLLLVQRVSATMSPAEHRRWRQWYDENADRAADASADASDWAPGFVHAAAELSSSVNLLRRLFRARS